MYSLVYFNDVALNLTLKLGIIVNNVMHITLQPTTKLWHKLCICASVKLAIIGRVLWQYHVICHAAF